MKKVHKQMLNLAKMLMAVDNIHLRCKNSGLKVRLDTDLVNVGIKKRKTNAKEDDVNAQDKDSYSYKCMIYI